MYSNFVYLTVHKDMWSVCYGILFLCPQTMSWNDSFLSRLAELSSTLGSESAELMEYSLCPLPTETRSDLNSGCPRDGLCIGGLDRLGMLLKQAPAWLCCPVLQLNRVRGSTMWSSVRTFSSLWQCRDTAL